MEILLQEGHHLLRLHAAEERDFPGFGFMRNLLFVSGEQGVGERNLTRRLELVFVVFLAIRAIRFVEFDRIGEIIDFSNLGQGLRHGVIMTLGKVSDKKPNDEGISSERISVNGQLPQREANGW
jgi:hypothetical protein